MRKGTQYLPMTKQEPFSPLTSLNVAVQERNTDTYRRSGGMVPLILQVDITYRCTVS
jgi:hypothetical protein